MDLVTVVSIIVLLAAMMLPVLAHLLRAHPRWFKAAKYGILGVYALANLYETLLFRTVQSKTKIRWKPLGSYQKSLSFPEGIMSLFNGTVEVIRPGLLETIVLNILLYIPLGYLLPFIFEKLKAWQVVLIAAACSTLTEVAQYVFRIGYVEVDDILNNTLGCIIGLLIHQCIRLCTSQRKTK